LAASSSLISLLRDEAFMGSPLDDVAFGIEEENNQIAKAEEALASSDHLAPPRRKEPPYHHKDIFIAQSLLPIFRKVEHLRQYHHKLNSNVWSWECGNIPHRYLHCGNWAHIDKHANISVLPKENTTVDLSPVKRFMNPEGGQVVVKNVCVARAAKIEMRRMGVEITEVFLSRGEQKMFRHPKMKRYRCFPSCLRLGFTLPTDHGEVVKADGLNDN
jgi:hypothetical protein